MTVIFLRTIRFVANGKKYVGFFLPVHTKIVMFSIQTACKNISCSSKQRIGFYMALYSIYSIYIRDKIK